MRVALWCSCGAKISQGVLPQPEDDSPGPVIRHRAEGELS
jgi:hypothetical protein